MINIYNTFGKYISIENLENKTKNNIDKNIYAYFILVNKKKRLTLYPYYMNDDMAKKGEFFLTKSRNNITLKLISDKSDEKNLAETELKSKKHINKLLIFRINNNVLEVKKNNYFKKVSLSSDKKLEINSNTNILHKFNYYPNNTIINITNNNPVAQYYKENIDRDMFYLKSSLEEDKYVTTDGCDTTDKDKAAIFSLIEGNFKLSLEDIPNKKKDKDGNITNIDIINRIKVSNNKKLKSKKYNLILIKKNKNIIKKKGLELLDDNIRNKPSFIESDKNIYNDYKLNVWI